jgi:Arylsulfotransferase (ASST)
MFSMRALILGATATLGLALAQGSAAGAQAGPTCGPGHLDNSALQDGSVTVSPLPGSRDASPRAQISFLGAPSGKLRVLSVVGSRSGSHTGRLEAYSNGDGASFLPSRPFAEGERVTVRAQLGAGGSRRALLDQFAVARQDSISSTPDGTHPGRSSEVQSFHSRPELQPPVLTVTAQSPAEAPGEEFVAPYAGPGQAGPMILDPNGGLVWFKPLPKYTSATNLRVQEYAGKPVLTWWQGDISVHGFGLGEGVIADSTYTDIAHVKAGNGLQADLHEFQLTPQGTALITAYDPIHCNLSSVGGPADGGVTDGVFQEIDVRTGLVMYEWTSLDHVGLSESYASAVKSSTAFPFDFFHINSIDAEDDGTFLISGRNTWTAYEIGADSGQILWRLGGKHSSFKLGSGVPTAWQHDPRQLPDGSISIFDNGASPTVHPQSRGVVVKLDPQHRSAKLVDQIVHTPPIRAESEGNMQALANGDWFVGWGQIADFSEFSPEGKLLFDAHFPALERSYRDLRFTWTGTPLHPPVFAFQAAAGGSGTAYASWNGATQVAAWRALSGPSPSSLTTVAQVPHSGFETVIPIPTGTLGPYLAVQALDAAGQVLGTSVAAAQSGLG